MSLVLVYPATTLAAALHFSIHSGLSVKLIGLAFLWDFSLGFLLMVIALRMPQIALIRALARLKDCRYALIDPQRYLSQKHIETMKRSSMAAFLNDKGLPYRAEAYARIFRVTMGESRTIPDSLGAFNTPFLGSVILVRDIPEDAEHAERFFFWHEISHSLGQEFAQQSAYSKGAISPLCALLLAAVILRRDLESFFILGSCVVAWLLIHLLWRTRRLSSRFHFETMADFRAVGFLSKEERFFVAENCDKILPIDDTLTPQENRNRIDRLKAALQTPNAELKMRQHAGEALSLIDSLVVGTNFLAWLVILAHHLNRPTDQMVFSYSVAVTILGFTAVLGYIRFYVVGFFIDFALAGKIRWVGGKPQWQRPATTSA